MANITVYNGDIDQALRSLRKTLQRNGTFKKFKDGLFFANATAVKKRKQLEHYKRRLRKKRMTDIGRNFFLT